MELNGDGLLAAGVALLALVTLPLLARAFWDIVHWESEPHHALGATAAMMGCLGVCGLVWAGQLDDATWLVMLFALVLLKLGLGLGVLFAWRTFRPQGITAASLAIALLALLTLSFALDFLTLRTDGSYPERSLGFILGQAVTGLPFLWIGVESGLAWRGRRRNAPGAIRHRFRGGQLLALSLASVAFFSECQLALAGALTASAAWQTALAAARGALYAIVAVCMIVAFYLPAASRHPLRHDGGAAARWEST